MQTIKVSQRLNTIDGPMEPDHTYFYTGPLATEFVRMANREAPGSAILNPVDFYSAYNEYSGEDLDGKTFFSSRTGGAGDLVMIMRALEALKEKYPASILIFATRRQYFSLLKGHPAIDELRAFPMDFDWIRNTDYHLHTEGTIERAPAARSIPGIDLFMDVFSVKGIPVNDRRPTLPLDHKAVKRAQDFLYKENVKPNDFIVGIQYMVEAPPRNYDQADIIEVAKELANEHGAKIVWIGSPNQADQIERSGRAGAGLITSSVNPAADHKVSSWGDTVAFSSLCDVVISADSAAVHIAGAKKHCTKPLSDFDYHVRRTTPVVGIYGPFHSRQRMSYYGDAIGLDPDVICAPCNLHGYKPCPKGFPSPCLKTIHSRDVVQAAMRLAARTCHKEIKNLDPYHDGLDPWWRDMLWTNPWDSRWAGQEDLLIVTEEDEF